jgi:hypothetical protein
MPMRSCQFAAVDTSTAIVPVTRNELPTINSNGLPSAPTLQLT